MVRKHTHKYYNITTLTLVRHLRENLMYFLPVPDKVGQTVTLNDSLLNICISFCSHETSTKLRWRNLLKCTAHTDNRHCLLVQGDIIITLNLLCNFLINGIEFAKTYLHLQHTRSILHSEENIYPASINDEHIRYMNKKKCNHQFVTHFVSSSARIEYSLMDD